MLPPRRVRYSIYWGRDCHTVHDIGRPFADSIFAELLLEPLQVTRS